MLLSSLSLLCHSGTYASDFIHVQAVPFHALAVVAPRGVDAGVAASSRGALINVLTSLAISTQDEPFPAGALKAPPKVGAVVSTAAVGHHTLVDIWK